jgi:hypothetical protein
VYLIVLPFTQRPVYCFKFFKDFENYIFSPHSNFSRAFSSLHIFKNPCEKSVLTKKKNEFLTLAMPDFTGRCRQRLGVDFCFSPMAKNAEDEIFKIHFFQKCRPVFEKFVMTG